MALRSYSTSPIRKAAPTICKVDADMSQCSIEQCSNSDSFEDDKSSVCSTNIQSQTPTLESLPPLPCDEQLDELEADGFDAWELRTDHVVVEVKTMVSDAPNSFAGKTNVGDASTTFQAIDTSTLQKRLKLEASAETIFGKEGAASLLDVSFPVAIADAELEGCPLIGCSTTFADLRGVNPTKIVGLNCRYLVDPVYSWEQVDQEARRHFKDFCLAAREGKQYRMPLYGFLDEWLMERPANEFIAVQASTHKDGTLFNSMFLMKIIALGDFDEERNYILALQLELPGRRSDIAGLRQILGQLYKNMAKVERMLGAQFITSGTMHRQEIDSDSDVTICSDEDENELF